MKMMIGVLALFSTLVLAQAPAQPKAPDATWKATGGVACNVWYIVDSETKDGFDAGLAYTFIPGVPMADVLDNHTKILRVLDQASKEQDKGGPYNIEMSEYRACDGGQAVKITEGSILIQGATLSGLNRITRVALKQANEITERFEKRAARGDKHAFDHSKAKKVRRDDIGRKMRD